MSESASGDGSDGSGQDRDSAADLADERTSFADHRTALASERTLYAVLRTGLAIAGGGAVVIELLGGDWPSWLKSILAGTLVVAGYAMIIAGLRRYEAVARQVEATSEGSIEVLSPRLMRLVTIIVTTALAVVILILLLGWFDSGAST